jgi:hypothetical protein
MSLGGSGLRSDSSTRSAQPYRRKRAKPSTRKTDKTENRITGLEGLAPPGPSGRGFGALVSRRCDGWGGTR